MNRISEIQTGRPHMYCAEIYEKDGEFVARTHLHSIIPPHRGKGYVDKEIFAVHLGGIYGNNKKYSPDVVPAQMYGKGSVSGGVLYLDSVTTPIARDGKLIDVPVAEYVKEMGTAPISSE